jgi:hypothetical protein
VAVDCHEDLLAHVLFVGVLIRFFKRLYMWG